METNKTPAQAELGRGTIQLCFFAQEAKELASVPRFLLGNQIFFPLRLDRKIDTTHETPDVSGKSHNHDGQDLQRHAVTRTRST